MLLCFPDICQLLQSCGPSWHPPSTCLYGRSRRPTLPWSPTAPRVTQTALLALMCQPRSCAPRSAHRNFRISKKCPVGAPELLPISARFEVKRPVGCERRISTGARVVPMMFAMTSILSLCTHQSFFAGPWEAYRLEKASPTDGFAGVHPGTLGGTQKRKASVRSDFIIRIFWFHITSSASFRKKSGGSDCHEQCP